MTDSSLLAWVEEYLSFRRALGFDLGSAASHLRSFAQYAEQQAYPRYRRQSQPIFYNQTHGPSDEPHIFGFVQTAEYQTTKSDYWYGKNDKFPESIPCFFEDIIELWYSERKHLPLRQNGPAGLNHGEI